MLAHYKISKTIRGHFYILKKKTLLFFSWWAVLSDKRLKYRFELLITKKSSKIKSTNLIFDEEYEAIDYILDLESENSIKNKDYVLKIEPICF